MLRSLGKSIWQRTIIYQRRGLTTLRHATILVLGAGVASVILMVSGHNPFVPAAVMAESITSSVIADGIMAFITGAATPPAAFLNVVGGFLLSVLGLLMVLMMSLTVAVASYDVTINTPEVIVAWKVLRDICNLFFVIILLVIAIGTTLRREQYMWNKNLPRFIIAAIFVNFSRTIVALVTDFADVVQQTFTSGFATTYFSKFVASFGIAFYPAITSTDIGAVDMSILSATPAIVIATICVCVVMAIMFVYFAMFVVRVVGLWLLAIFGPVAFVSSILPQTQKYYKDWWSKLSSLAILGPMLAFFMWLAVTIVPTPKAGAVSFSSVLDFAPPQLGAAAQPDFIVGFCIMTIILYFGMQQGMGMAGDFGSAVGKAQSFAFGTMLGGVSSAAAFAGKDLWSRVDSGQAALRGAAGKSLKGAGWNRLGSLVGAGGTFTGSLDAFRERALERQKERLKPGAEKNKQLATNVGTWPALTIKEIILGKSIAGGQRLEKGGATFEGVIDNANNPTVPFDERKKDNLKDLNDERTKADAALKNGEITEAEHKSIMDQAAATEAYLNTPAWDVLKQQDEVSRELEEKEASKKASEDSVAESEKKYKELGIQGDAIDKRLKADPWADEAPKSPEERAALAAQLTKIQDDRLLEGTKITDERVNASLLTAPIEALRAKLADLEPQVKGAKDSLRNTEDDLRAGNSDLVKSGQHLSTGSDRGAFGQMLVNLATDAGTERFHAEKERWEASVKGAEHTTGFDPKNLAIEFAKAFADQDGNRVYGALMGLAKKEKLSALTTNPLLRPIAEQLMRSELKAKDPGITEPEVETYLKKFRNAPGDKVYVDAVLQGALKRLNGGDKDVVAKLLGNIKDAARESGGANAAATYTDTVTGSSKLIEMDYAKNEKTGEWTVKYGPKATKGLESDLGKLKPTEYLYNLKKDKMFALDSEGLAKAISSQFESHLKQMPSGLDQRHIRNWSEEDKRSFKENTAMLERWMSEHEGSEAAKNTKKILKLLKEEGTASSKAE